MERFGPKTPNAWRVRAVITAGGTVESEFAASIGTRTKALAPFGEGTLIDVVVTACRGAGIADVAVVGPPDVQEHLRAANVRAIDAAADGATNVQRALGAWPGERFVYLASDLPFASAEGVADLVRRSGPFALAMAVCDAAAYAARFPGAPPHAVRLRGTSLANGSAFVIGPDALEPLRAVAARFFDARKSLFALARLLGPLMCARYVVGQLGVRDVEAYAGRMLGVPAGAVDHCDPGLCYDVDDLAGYRDACTRRG
jgi:CTP:molybdopterin cytidylyltransferase MocA